MLVSRVIGTDAPPKELLHRKNVDGLPNGGRQDQAPVGAKRWPGRPARAMESNMSTLGIVLLVILILLLIGAIPSWGHSRSWGYGPSGILGVILIIVIILLLMGRL